ncbi:MAG: BACON domain-containing protein [Muribaculaceae bacterium]
MRTITIAVYLLALACCSCSKTPGTEHDLTGNGDGNEPAVLELNASQLSFTSQGGSQTVEVRASKAWTAHSEQSWCGFSPASGAAGNTLMAVTIGANPDYTSRSTTIYVAMGTTKALVSISQEAKAQVIVAKDVIDVDAKGGDTVIAMKSNVAWTIASTESWLSASPQSGSHGTTGITVSVDANTTGAKRSGKLIITAAGEEFPITVNQSAE